MLTIISYFFLNADIDVKEIFQKEIIKLNKEIRKILFFSDSLILFFKASVMASHSAAVFIPSHTRTINKIKESISYENFFLSLKSMSGHSQKEMPFPMEKHIYFVFTNALLLL